MSSSQLIHQYLRLTCFPLRSMGVLKVDNFGYNYSHLLCYSLHHFRCFSQEKCINCWSHLLIPHSSQYSKNTHPVQAISQEINYIQYLLIQPWFLSDNTFFCKSKGHKYICNQKVQVLITQLPALLVITNTSNRTRDFHSYTQVRGSADDTTLHTLHTAPNESFWLQTIQ